MTKTIRLLGISGSIRKNAFNTVILETIAERLPQNVEMKIFSLQDIPLYNQDEDTVTPPQAVQALRQAIADADGIIISSPEYIYGMSGVLKNALDWASRPYAASTMIGKPVFTMTASPATTGGVRAQAQLNEAVTAIGARLVLRPQTVLASVHEKITDNRLTDEASLSFVEAGIADLLKAIEG